MKKIFSKIVAVFMILTMLITTNVFATTEISKKEMAKAADVKMEVVEDNICKIKINEECEFEKKLVNKDLENHTVTLQLKVSNNSKIIIPEGELILVIDSSTSMDSKIDDNETTRKEVVLNSANKLVKSLLEANPETLKIGVVTFSTSSQKNEEGFLITGTEADAQKVCDLTNDVNTLTEKISAINGEGPYTNLDSGLQLAKKQFSDKETNKYMIILTDGLPNLAVGYNDLVSYKGTTDVINQTKKTLNSLENIELITMLTGITEGEAILKEEGTNTYTYNQVITEVFGSEENPTKGKFYNISDNEIEKTITEKIYQDLVPVEKILTNIKVVDYIPQDIAENFEIKINEESKELKATISEDKKIITWEIEKLGAGETQALKFDIILNEEFNKEIIDKILNTNEKVDITYNDFDGEKQEKTSDITPKIKLVEIVKPVQNPEPPKDNTVVQEKIPAAGTPIYMYGFIIGIILTIIFYIRYKKL